jgi:arylformamidase
MLARHASRSGRAELLIALFGVCFLLVCAAAPAQESKAPAIEPPDRSKPYNDAILELAANSIVTRDIPYTQAVGSGAELQTLDIYAPEKAEALPVVVYVHGGGWSRGDKREVGSQPKMFNESGVVLVAVNYRLSPEVKYPTHVNDIAAGIAWVRAHIARYGGNPQKLVVMGHSAGSHLASLVATHPEPLGKQGMKVSELKGAISLDGSGFDLVERLKTGEEKVSAAYTRAFGSDRAVFADASPIEQVKRGARPPAFLLTYVKADSVNYTQAKAFADQVLAAGGRAELAYIEGKDHATLASDLGTSRDTAGTQIVDFVRSVTSK